jgi:excinuclease ABC subunit C
VRRAIEKQQIVAERSEDIDVIGIADDELEASVQVFFVRKGRVVGRKGFVVDKVEDIDRHELVDKVLEGLYLEEPPLGVPKTVLVPDDPADAALYEWWLCEQRGSRVDIRVPQRGDKRSLLETVTRNAQEEFTRHRLRRASDHNSRAQALNELRDALDLPEAPLRIECFDMSHIQGSDYVGSMVVVEDGLPKKSEYRRFKIKSGQGNDDFAAMEEVLTRRFSAYLDDAAKPVSERGGKFSYPPQLLVVDGGKGQLGVAMRVLHDLGLEDEIPVCSLAKQFEEVFVPGKPDPIRLPRQSEALYLLQRLRDESHRFAITYHRQLRNKRTTTSVLDDIPGLGPHPQEAPRQGLGGVKAVKTASLGDLKALTWLPDPSPTPSTSRSTTARAHLARPHLPFDGASSPTRRRSTVRTRRTGEGRKTEALDDLDGSERGRATAEADGRADRGRADATRPTDEHRGTGSRRDNGPRRAGARGRPMTLRT